MNALVDVQVRHNQSSRDCWELFRSHRQQTTDLLRGAGSGRLCVLGAGNCNDLDLAALLTQYREVHLVDLDAEALAQGAARQSVSDRPGLRLHGGVDVTGLLHLLAQWPPDTPFGAGNLAACSQWPVRKVAPQLPGPFDVVASTCLLSQLVGAVVRTFGADNPLLMDPVLAVRAGHLNLLLHLLTSGGVGVLITDVVSTESFPALRTLPEDALEGVIPQLAQARNFFHGVNPVVLESLFRTGPVWSGQVADVDVRRSWRWDFNARRSYLVWALRFRKA